MKKYLLIIFVYLHNASAYSQQAPPSFWYAPKVGEQYYSYPIVGEMNPGQSGTNQNWDYSNLEFGTGYVTKVVLANYERNQKKVEGLGVSTPDPHPAAPVLPKLLYKLTSDSLFYLGRNAAFDIDLYTNPITIFAKNPVQYNYTLTDIFFYDRWSDFQNPTASYSGKSTTLVDGQGKLTLPNRATFDAFRVKIITEVTNISTRATIAYTSLSLV